MNIKKWKKFIESLEDNVDFNIKKIISKYESKIKDIKLGSNIFNDIFLDSKLEINIIWNKSNKNIINGETDIFNAVKNDFEQFNITINIESEEINKSYLLSVISHEIKHIYDILCDSSDENSFLDIPSINRLKKRFFNFKPYFLFIHMVYESLKHEMEARNSQIYYNLKYLGYFDKDLIKKEYEKTYTYKSLFRLKNYDHKKFISSFNEKDLINFTNDFINIYGKFTPIKNKSDLYKFYFYWESFFKKTSDSYLLKSYKIIDELIKDIKPYMEGKLTTEHLYIDNKELFKTYFLEKLKIIYENIKI